jgi:cytochrome c oxidase subunit 1
VNRTTADYAHQDTYYVVPHWHYELSFVGAWIVFAVAYARLRPSSAFRRRLGWAHLTVSIAGGALIFGPAWALPLTGMPRRYADLPNVFEQLNWISSAGYGLTLLGLLIFVCLLADTAARALASAPRRKSG